MNVFTIVKACSRRARWNRSCCLHRHSRNIQSVKFLRARIVSPQIQYDTSLTSCRRIHTVSEDAGAPKVLVLAGPTAIGKSAVGLRIAELLDGEIISADSAQVYRDLNIGTAKPVEEIQQRVPHHLIDISPTDEQFSTGDFVKLARAAIKKILARGKTPIIVGGSAFYLRNLIEGLPGTPPNDTKVELRVEDELAGMEWEDALALLTEKDADYASTLSANDWKRLKRAFNIIETSGRPVSSFSAGSSADDKEASRDFDFKCVFLTSSRLDLYARIDERCEQMVRDGFIEEVIRLQHNGQLERWMPAAQALGYRQALDFLDNEWFTTLTRSKQRRRRAVLRFIAIFQAATRNYARKQIAWFRNHEDRFVWLYRDFEPEDDAYDDAYDDEAAIAQRIVERFQLPWEVPTPKAVEHRRNKDIQSVVDAQMGRYEAVPLIFDDVAELDAVVHSIRATLAPLYAELGLVEEIAAELSSDEEDEGAGRGRGRGVRHVDDRSSSKTRPHSASAARRARRRERKQLY